MRSVTLTCIYLLAGAAFACAQNVNASSMWVNTGNAAAFEVEIPFPFSVGKVVLEGGAYRFSPDAANSRLSISHKGYEMKAKVVEVISQLGGPTRVQDPTLVFDNSERYHILSEVWIPGSVGLLVHVVPSGHTLETIIGRGFDRLSGKETFDRTCKKCHGSDGKGDPDADKFFRTAIPRLDSEYVQAKSDAELKQIVSQGSRKMPPVRLDDPGIGHLIPLSSLDALIEYLRTLKAK